MSVSIPIVYKGMYLGNMNQNQAELLQTIRNMKVVPNLKKTIFNFDMGLINQSILEHRSIREILTEQGADLNNYISELRDYQTVGTAFMYASPRSILGDGVGLGKTAEISALLNFLKLRGEMTRFLMAVENSAIGQTVIELMRFTGLYVVMLPTTKAKIKKFIEQTDWKKVDGILICHSTLRSDYLSNWIALNISDDGVHCKLFNVFVLDESSVIKNAETKMYEYTRNIANLCDRVYFLNATVFETNLMDIYYQVDMMNPVLLPRKSKVEQMFCKYKKSTFWKTEYDPTTGAKKPMMKFKRELDGYKNQAQFKSLLKLVYFSRCKADVGMNIPHIYKVYEVEPSQNQKIAIGMGYRYQEVLNCPSLIPEINMETNRKNVPKLDRLVEIIQNEFSDSEVMVYCFHKEAQESIKRELEAIGRKPVILNGDTPSNDRLEIQQKFNSGEYDTLVTNIKKSLNLHGGDVCILYSVETNVAKMEQIRGRIDRNVDGKIKTFIMMYYKDSGESEFIKTVVKQRAKDARDLTVDAETAATLFMDAMENG